MSLKYVWFTVIARLKKATPEPYGESPDVDNPGLSVGVRCCADPITHDGLDVRFAVNTIAPYLLTQRLLPLLSSTGRVINVSSAGQSPADLEALAGRTRLSDEYVAYAQSKLTLTMWSRSMALSLRDDGPAIIAVNPGSLLASKMVTEGFGVAGSDIGIGAIL